MGNKNSSSSSSSPPFQSSDANAPSHKVILHVYQPPPGQRSIPGFGIYHTGVELDGSEYTYAGGTGATGTGVQVMRPMQQPSGSQWVYEKSLEMGTVKITKNEIRELLHQLRSEFPASAYHITSKNCNHFSEAFCRRLGFQVPSWINRAARVGETFKSSIPKEQQPVLTEEGMQVRPEHIEALKLNANIEWIDLVQEGFLDLTKMGCLNQNDHHSIHSIVHKGGEFATPKLWLESDADEQLLIYFPFQKPVKLLAIQLALSISGFGQGPKSVKVYTNKPAMDFSDTESIKPTQSFLIPSVSSTPFPEGGGVKFVNSDVKKDLALVELELKLVHFQGLNYCNLLIESNHGAPTTRLHGIRLIGRDNAK